VPSATSLFGDDATILRETDFQLLSFATVLPVLGTALLSPLLDSLIEPFGASSATIGLTISAFTAPPILMIPVAGMLADRYGRKRVLVASLLIFGLAGTAIAFTTDFRVVLALRVLQGVGFAGINPVIITSIGDLYSGGAEATGQGIRFMMSGLSGAVFPLLAGLLVLVAWQYPFLLYAVAIPIAAGVYRWFDEPTPTRTAAADGGDGVADDGSYLRALARLGRRRRVLALVVGRSLMTVVWIGFLTYNSLIVGRLMGGTSVQAGLLATAGFLTFAVSAGQAGRLSSRFGSRFSPLVAANVALGGGFLLLLFAPGVGVAAVGVTTAGVGFGVLGSLYRSIITDLAPPELRAGLVGLSEAGGRLTGTLTPLATGGAVAVGAPRLGFAPALQLAGLGLALVGSGGGICCLLVARAAASPADRGGPTGD
jgi:MFS family permease